MIKIKDLSYSLRDTIAEYLFTKDMVELSLLSLSLSLLLYSVIICHKLLLEFTEYGVVIIII